MKPIALACLLAVAARAQEPAAQPRKDLATNLSVRGKLVFSDDFSGPELSKEWKVAKGKWEIVDGTLKGTELPSDNHAAVIKHPLPARNVVLQFSFQFNGARSLALSFDGKGHVCRVTLSPTGFQVVRNVPKDGGEKPAILGKGAIDLKAGEWHALLVEIQGREMLAQVDDKVFAFGENDGIDLQKTTFGFPTGGESIRIDDVRVWEATPNPDWPSLREKLAQAGK
jgi:hypothetical protein